MHVWIYPQFSTGFPHPLTACFTIDSQTYPQDNLRVLNVFPSVAESPVGVARRFVGAPPDNENPHA